MFYRNFDEYEGLSVRLYREPSEIKKDIKKVRMSIDSLNGMLNIRNILLDAISRYQIGEPQKWIPALREMVEEAEETLDELRSLKENLEMLTCELEDTKCALGI